MRVRGCCWSFGTDALGQWSKRNLAPEDTGEGVGLGQGSPGTQVAWVSCALTGLPPLSLLEPQNLCLKSQSLKPPFPICSRLFTFLISVLNNCSFSCPIHISHSALQVSELWILL